MFAVLLIEWRGSISSYFYHCFLVSKANCSMFKQSCPVAYRYL